MYCQEAFASATDTIIKFEHHFEWMDDKHLFPSNGVGHSPSDFLTLVEEYSRRSLSYESDILYGVLGILRAFEDIEDPIRHYWGVPILASYKGSTKEGFIAGLCSFTLQPSTRRRGFPSWS